LKSVFQLIFHYTTKHRKIIHFPKKNYFPSNKRGLSVKHHILTAYMSCSISVNPSLLRIVDKIDFRNNTRKVHFWNFISEVINLSDIGLINPFCKVSLFTLISVFFGQILSLITDKALIIKLLSNSFIFYNKLLLIFIVGLYHLFHNICF